MSSEVSHCYVYSYTKESVKLIFHKFTAPFILCHSMSLLFTANSSIDIKKTGPSTATLLGEPSRRAGGAALEAGGGCGVGWWDWRRGAAVCDADVSCCCVYFAVVWLSNKVWLATGQFESQHLASGLYPMPGAEGCDAMRPVFQDELSQPSPPL